MLINGIKLSSLGAQLYDRVLSSNDIETTNDWLDSDIQPTFIRQQDTFKNITLKFLITEQNEEDAFVVMSNLTMLLKKAVIVFDDMSLEFDVTMKGSAKQERLKNGNFIYTVNLESDYAKGQDEVYTTNTAATDSFKLTVVYYKDSTTLLGTESVTINASSFVGVETISLKDLGIDTDKYQEAHYNKGMVTNFVGQVLSYANLYSLGTMVINYAPTVYSKEVGYYLNAGDKGAYNLVESTSVSFTFAEYQKLTAMGQLVNLNKNRPSGYKAKVTPDVLPTFDELMAMQGSINVYFDIIENEQKKEITVNYFKETNNGDELITSNTIVVKEGDVVEGTVISDILNLNGQKPNDYYQDGYCKEIDDNILLTFDALADSYTVQYDRIVATIYVEYYLGSYPNWMRAYTDTCKIKYDESFDTAEDLIAAVGIDVNKYSNSLYEPGAVFNPSVFTDFNALASIGVVQVYYIPKEYTITVKYMQDNDDGTPVVELGTKDYTITDLMFAAHPALSQIININAFRADGFAYSEDDSYHGLVSLEALTQNSPITITYKPVAVVKTKSIVIRYKKQLASTYSTINTSVITIEEAAVGGGIKLKDLFEINKYRPDYYNEGIIDGYSANATFLFDEIQGAYDVYYLATNYSTQVRYYTDEVAAENWIGSDRITYTVLSFEADTTAVSLGLNLNAYKPSYCGDGVIQYYGQTTFINLISLESIDVVYPSEREPEDEEGIDYPHRILFLQHNDMGSYDSSFPTWTLNHAYINTGVTCTDMSKLTVAMSTVRVFEDQPLYNVNVGDRYLFGAISPNGGYYIKYQNNTTYTPNATGHNYFMAQAGKDTPILQIEEDADNGFSRNTGIYASDRAGYSYATLKYSNLIQSNAGQMLIPLYLFACNYNGSYTGGIAGVGITACKIYYDDVLIRDFVPVQFYDLIGTKVAPSNCLYDKVTQTFFEDARRMNSFNIMDDEEYEDKNPLHNIGKCYCNYYKGGDFFQTRVIYFRESDFVNGNVWDPEVKLGIDEYQPQFYGQGTITNLDKLGGITFNNVKEFVFNVNYPATGYYIDINYYRDSDAIPGNLIKSEQVYLTEKMFYQVPTFGQIVDLLKYKPQGYGLQQGDIPYTDTKVTLQRLLNKSPFNIVYTEWPNPEEYTIKVKYYKHKFWIDPKNPLNEYTFLGEKEVIIDATQIIDGQYPDNFIDFDAFKPADEPDYWYNGTPFEWYRKDENLITPDDLRDEYIVVYEPKMQYIDINYYTDEVDEENLIANSIWGIKINDWDFGYEFQVVDELPNSYLNKYKPANCDGGILQESEKYYTFDSLVKQGHLDIVYMTRQEPHDPEDNSFPSKVLWYYPDTLDNNSISDGMTTGNANLRDWTRHNGGSFFTAGIGARIPYLDLGYTPKEIQRLRMQSKYYSLGGSMLASGHNTKYAPVSDDYMGIAGYLGPMSREKLNNFEGADNAVDSILGSGVGQDPELYSYTSPESSGCFFLKGHCPTGNFGGASSRASSNIWGGVTWVDNNNGMKWSNTAQTQTTDPEIFHSCFKQVTAGFRFGNYCGYDEDLEPFKENDDHIYWANVGDHKGHAAKSFSNAMAEIWRSRERNFKYPDDMDSETNSGTGESVKHITNADTLATEGWWDMNPSTFFHPYTVTLDAYHGFCEIYDMSNSEDPYHWDIPIDKDLNLFNDRCKPKGPITLFVTTNPDTGEVNIAPDGYFVMPWMQNYNDTIFDFSSSAGSDSSGNAGSGTGAAGGTIGSGSGSGSNVQGGATGGSSGGGSGSGSQLEIYGGLLNMEYNPYTTQMDCPWGHGRVDAFPVPMRTAIWSMKIWDRDKLVRDLIPVAKGDKVYDYVMPENGMFDKVTEIFFGNVNEGGDYGKVCINAETKRQVKINPEDVFTLRVNDDPTIYGKIIANYYDFDNSFIGNQYVEIPCDYFSNNIKFKDILRYNDMKPSLYYHDGMIDTDVDIEDDIPNRDKLKPIFDQGAINIYYKQKQYTKTVVYYQENSRIASKDFFFSEQEIKEAKTLADLGVDANLYQSDEFKPGIVMSDETIIASDDVAAFINAPSPIVVYKKWSKEERPDLFYYEYYRGGAYEEEGQETITVNSDNANYLDCDLTATVLNPNGLIKYVDHYHDALYEDEKQTYFIAYQVDVNVNYCEVHKGPARGYSLLATIVDRGRYTIVEENRGWGRLKEYPKGWILLANTKPITGPGQNPDYDDQENTKVNVTIPFATKLTISKMTIDRLWAYTPEYGSWIKTEEISFDQSGRLYNALGIAVIKLDEVDWSKITSLSDLKINPEKLRPRFHNECGWTYDGPFTKEAFSNLHSVDFVYPETVYPYVVKYYKDTIEDKNEVGNGAFSCSLSDWNPDWDTFLSTSWRTGWPGEITKKDTFHRTLGMTKDYTNTAIKDKVYVLSRTTTTIDDVDCYYCIWKGYIGYYPVAALSVNWTLEETITPTLYRSDEPIMLTWDFYGLDANLYKPGAEYNDGMFLWNPRTYDNKTINFSFEEIITTGKQTVLYTPVMDIGYKAKFTCGWMQLPLGIKDFYLNPTNENPGIWDLEIKYQQSSGTDSTLQYHPNVRQTFSSSDSIMGSNKNSVSNVDWQERFQTLWSPISGAYSNKEIAIGINGDPKYLAAFIEGSVRDSYYNIVNFSNKRDKEKAICQFTGNDLTNWENQTPTFSITRSSIGDPEAKVDIKQINVGDGAYYSTNYGTSTGDIYKAYKIDSAYNIIYHIKSWKNYYLEHYYVPIPRGYWLPNGTQMQNNGFYDLITQTIVKDFAELNGYVDVEEDQRALPEIYKLHTTPEGSSYDYFSTWEYGTENVDYIVKTTAKTNAYKHPDVLSEVLTIIDKDVVIPVKKKTADSAHHVKGTWYFTGKYWIQATAAPLFAYTDYPIGVLEKTVTLKGDTSNTAKTYFGYRRPDDTEPAYFDEEAIHYGRYDQETNTGIKVNDAYTVELIAKAISLEPSSTSSIHTSSGYIFGNYRMLTELSDLGTAGEYHKITIKTSEDGTKWEWYRDDNLTTPIKSRNKTESAETVDGNLRINSCGYHQVYGNSTKYYFVGQSGIYFSSIKIWNKNNELIASFKPISMYENGSDTPLHMYWYEEISQKTLGYNSDKYYSYFDGDKATNGKAWVSSRSNYSTFTTETRDSIFASANDFYWNGAMWIPASYTDDYINELDTPKTYIVATGTLYTYRYPIETEAYKHSNLLAGDRLTVVATLGKDAKWYKLNNGYWVFNNNTLNELENEERRQ